jgi:RimJ/RimL family protein N-acetyltransferase
MMTEASVSVELESPFPPEVLLLVWQWLCEYPDQNFDDFGPKNVAEFINQLEQRDKAGERMWMVRYEGRYVGFIGFTPATPIVGTFHLCFAREVHGKGVAREAIMQMLWILFQEGVEKVQAMYFADNWPVRRFLKKLNAKDEGFLISQTTRKGLPTDMYMVALFKGDT